MPDNSREKLLTQYGEMSTEQLRQLLREEASVSEGEEDISRLLCILEVLSRRTREQERGRTPEAALQEFKEQYLEEDLPEAGKKRKQVAYLFRRMVAAVAIFVLLIFTGIGTAKVLGFDVLAVFVNWTENGFFLSKDPDATVPLSATYENCTAYLGLQHMLEVNGVTEKLVPRWIPAGFAGEDVRMVENTMQKKFYAQYESARGAMMIGIVEYAEGLPTLMEHDRVLYEPYEKDGTVYFITSNGSYLRAAWLTETYECNIFGPFTVEELKQIIDSIG